jgi:hypothetical protein
MRHPVRGLVIGPLVAPPVYWIGVAANAWIHHVRLDWFESVRELSVIVAYGLPVTFVATLVWAAPIVYGLRRMGWLRAATLIPAGALGGTLVAAVFALDQQGAMFRVLMPLPAGALLGALAAGTCWWAGRGNAHERTAS